MTHSQDIFADVLIITVTPVESRAVLQAFEQATGEKAKSVTVEDRTYRNLGTINGSKVFMAFSRMGSIGLGASQQAVQKSVEALNPYAVIMVGIAFGMNEEKQAIGDILVAEKLMLYEPQRISVGEIESRGIKVPCATSLYNYLYNAHLDWDDVEVSFGLVLTGEKLIDNLDYRESLKKLETEAIGGEMEGAGLYTACQEKKVDWILVKAICDWADGNKNQDKKQRQAQAAKNAAEFVVHALQHATLPRLDKQTKPNSESQHLSTEVKDSTINGNVITAGNIDNSFNKTEINNYYDQKNIEIQLSDNWFKSHIETSISDLGHRYTQEFNFELDIAKNFDALSRSDKFIIYFESKILKYIEDIRKFSDKKINHDVVEKFISNLNIQIDIVKNSRTAKFDVKIINDNCNSIERLLSQYWRLLKDKENYLSEKEFYAEEFCVKNLYEVLNNFKNFINSSIMRLVNLPVMLLSGKQGYGKSHLLGDIANKKTEENKACILLLGQHFTSRESPWMQILNNLLIKCNQYEFLENLNVKAEIQGERLLFVIDAINEGEGRNFWKDHIRGFINSFSNYPWLSLVISIRTSYEPLITPIELIPDNIAIRVVHYGFTGVEYQAASLFFFSIWS